MIKMESPPTSEEPTRDGHDPPRQPSVLTSELTRKLEYLTTKIVQLDEKVTQLNKNQITLHQTNTQLLAEFEDHRKSLQTLRKDHICLRTDYTRLRMGHAGLQDDHTNLETTHRQLRTDHRKMEQTLAELKLYLSTFQEEHQQVLDDHRLLKKEQEKLAPTVPDTSFEQPTTPPHAGKQQEVHITTDKEEASTSTAEITPRPQTLASVEDRDVQQELSAGLQRLSSDVSRLGNDCRQLHTEMAELRTLQGELVGNQNKVQVTNKPEVKQGELHSDKEEQETVHEHTIRNQKEHFDTVSEEQRNVQQQHEALASELDVLRMHVELMATSLQESQNKASHDLSVLETRLRRAKRLFYARELNTSRTLHGQAMIFNVVLVEDERHYNQQTGVFRAPQPGLYFFTASVESCSEDTAAFCRIVIDCDIQCVVQGGFFGGSGCVLVPLSAGQKVWLMAYNPSGRCGRWSSNGSFSGTLVVPLQENPAAGT